jgi:hypothetical protein
MKKVFEWFAENGTAVLVAVVFAMLFGCMILPFLIAIARELWAWALA